MSNKISNTTSLTFEYAHGEKPSHLLMSTTATMNEKIEVSLASLEEVYYQNESITYVITINNNNNSKLESPMVVCNLGSYLKTAKTEISRITPLDYVGPAHLYLNGIFQNSLEPEIKNDQVIFKPLSIPEKTTVLIIFKTMANQFSPISLDSKIENKISLKLSGSPSRFKASHTIPIAKKAILKICKNIFPKFFSRGESIQYSITLYNYGNIAAENIKITDTFDPAPTLTNIKIDEKDISSTDYSYTNGIFNLPIYGSDLNITVPGAEFETESTSHTTSIHPGITNIIITGIL